MANRTLYVNLISGIVCGFFNVLVVFPLDTIKVRLQTGSSPSKVASNDEITQSSSSKSPEPIYSSTWDCFKQIVRYEGFKGLYKGLSVPLMANGPIYAVSFTAYGVAKKYIFNQQDQLGNDLEYWHFFISGSISGFCTSFLLNPTERVKLMFQMQKTSHTSCCGTLYHLIKDEGLCQGPYRGLSAMLLRDVAGNGIWYTCYEFTMDVLIEYANWPIFISSILSGAVSGLCFWTYGLPFDVLKNRMQVSEKPVGIVTVFRQLIKEAGPRGLYKGVIPIMLGSIPANTACLLGYELSRFCIEWIETKIN